MVSHRRESGQKPRSGQAEKRPEKTERVAKALARAGVASRREVERLIGLGRVAVNGRILATPAVLVTRSDVLTVDGKVVNAPEAARLWRYHKPVGLMTTHRDPGGRPTVFEALPRTLPRVISIGRLDLNSEGLLLLTNDGDLARALELPARALRRVYRARAHGRVTQVQLDELKNGITVEGVHYGAIEAKLDKAEEKAGAPANVWITLSLSEGKNREVRRVLEALGLRVNRLIRLAYGPFQLGVLGEGEIEEVGPRVIREQLAEFIAPDMLPKGDRVEAPPPAPARRPGASKRVRTANVLADPRKKPSRVRAQAERAQAERTERAEQRPPRRDGKPGFKPQRDFGAGLRRASEGDERPPRRDGKPGFKPRRDFTGGPRRSDEGGERPPRRDGKPGFKPRQDNASGPRRSAEGDERRPLHREGKPGFKPRRDFSSGPQRSGEGGSERPGGGRPYAPKPGGHKGGKPGFKPRHDAGPRSPRSDEAGARPEGGRPYERKPGFKGGKPGGPKRSYGGPRAAGGGEARRDGDRPKGPGGGFKGGPRGGKPGFKPKGSGPRGPGGPGGKPARRGTPSKPPRS